MFFPSKKSLCECRSHTEPRTEAGPRLFPFLLSLRCSHLFPNPQPVPHKLVGPRPRTGRDESQEMFFCKCESPHALIHRPCPASAALRTQSRVVRVPFSSTGTQGSSCSHLLRDARCPLQTQCHLSTAPSSCPTCDNEPYLCRVPYCISHPCPFGPCLGPIRVSHSNSQIESGPVHFCVQPISSTKAGTQKAFSPLSRAHCDCRWGNPQNPGGMTLIQHMWKHPVGTVLKRKEEGLKI